ncbi:MAG: transposase [Clostridia bacterium]|nr:transposase [Clostridia bacterium]
MTNDGKKADFRLLFLVVSQKLGLKAEEVFTHERIPVQYHVHAKGTASGEVADMLGLGGVDKTLLMSMLPKTVADGMLLKLRNHLYLGSPNSGVAFTMPLSGVSACLMHMMQALEHENGLTERNDNTTMDNRYTMIMAFVNQGFSEAVMAAARPAGARGGTVFHSRRAETEEAHQFWGISVQEEREIVMILAEKEQKTEIMKAITEKCGMQSEAHGMVLSVPVDSVAGLNKDLLE